MKKHFLNKFPLTAFILLLFCLLPLLVLYRWFSGGTILYFWDINFPLDPAVGLSHFYYLWKTNIFPGFFDTGWSWLPYIVILFIFNSLFHSDSAIQALLFWCLLVSSLVTFYFLLRHLFRLLGLKDGLFLELIKIIGAILYTFNTYVYYYSFRIFNPQEFIIAFLPLHFLALLHLYPIEKKGRETKKDYILWLLVFFVSLFLMISGFSTLIYYIEYLGIIGFYLLFQTIKRRQYRIKEIIYHLIFLFMIFIFNLWWFFPMYLGLNDAYTRGAQIGTTIYFTLNSQLSNLLNATRLIGLPPMQTPIFSWENLYTQNVLFTFPLFIFPLFILLLAVKFSKISAKGTILFLFTIFTVSLFFVKEGNPPFSFILQFAFNHIPLFGVFRDAYQKAGLFYMFTYFLLFTISLGVIYENLFWKKKFFASMIIIFSIIATVIITAPFFIFQNIPFVTSISGDQQITFSAKTKVPTEYFSLKNFLEPRCQTTEVMVIPRTSILSSGYWSDTGYSYVGQDILSNLIDCSFISTQLLDNNIDAVYAVPYLALQQGDVNDFKSFLFHSDIRLLVVRHDYVSNSVTDYVPVNANAVMRILDKDHDFRHIYGNKLFDVYSYTPVKGATYGVAFSQATVFTNADFTSGNTDQTLFHAISSLPLHIFINTSETVAQSGQGNVIFANCIGCEYLPGSGELDENATPQIQENHVMKFLKMLLHRTDNNVVTLDTGLNNMDTAFQSWVTGGSAEDAKNYITDLNTVINIYNKSLSSDFFNNDYKTIKVKNYLLNEYMVLSQKLYNVQDFTDVEKIENLQRTKLAQVENKMWETDFKSDIFRYRLDIPESKNYVCQIVNNNKLISVHNLTIDKKSVSNGAVFLQKGSHKVEVSYSSKGLYSQNPLILSGNKIIVKKIQLHGFTPGNYYTIAMQTATASAENINVFISDKNISSQAAIEIVDKQNQNFLYDSAASIKDFFHGVNDYFYSSNTYNGNYYLYIIVNLQDGQHQLSFTKFAITPIPTKDTLITYCQSSISPLTPSMPISVNKQSPIDYMITVGGNNTLHDRILTFNQSYQPFWEAYTIINGKKHIYKHFLQAGYANAWYIDAVGNGKIYLQFTEQKKSEIVAVVSVLLFLVLLGIYIILYK